MSLGADILGVTEETFSLIKATTNGILQSTGLYGVDLQPLVSLVPVDTPFRNSTPRMPAPQGAQYAYWRSLQNVNNQQLNPAVPFDYAGPIALIDERDVFAPFSPLAQGGSVTWDALAQSMGYADALAVDTLQTLNQLMIGDDINQLNAISFPLPSIATPSGTTSTTGGSIASGASVNIKVAARSGNNFYYGGSGPASANFAVTVGTTTSTNSVTATVAAVECAVAYDWYVGSTSSNQVYYTTTTVNTVTITMVPTAAQPVPTSSYPLLSSVQPSTPPTADTSYNTYWMNGLLGSILGDFSNSAGATNLTTPGSGTSQGAYFKSLDGGQFHVSGASVAELDALNQAIYDKWQLSPTRYLMGSQSVNDLTNAFLNSPQAVAFLQPSGADGRNALAMGGSVSRYFNKTVNGKPISIELQPHLAPGTVIAVTDEIPFPGANIDVPLSVETQLDYARFDYGANRQLNTSGGGPRYDFEIRSVQAFRNKAAATMGVISNIAPGVA